MTTRLPDRMELADEFGRRRTLSGGPDAFARLPGGPDVLLLGLGPEPGAVPDRSCDRVLYLDAPAFLDGLGRNRRAGIPEAWQRLGPADLTLDLLRRSEVLFYRQNLRLFPSFWGPIWGQVLASRLAPAMATKGTGAVVAASDGGLLTRELEDGLRRHGVTVRRVAPDRVRDDLAMLLSEERPALFASVNLQGLDPDGEVFHLLAAAGVTVASWLVDNPFHLISGLRSPFWRQVALFVTDDWFLEPLREHGAAMVRHLPLAAWPSLCARPPGPGYADLNGRVAFVGRSEFPAKRGFFSGVPRDPALIAKAGGMLEQGQRPDFAWWTSRLGLRDLWPGKEVRSAGLGAEEAGRAWRAACLGSAAPLGLTIFGDRAWRALLPDADLRPEIDYYGPLADIYRQAGYSLNMTSLLLPHGLTQRHFDVWSCGGTLVTDRTPGLSLFPSSLTEPVTFTRPADIPAVIARLERDPALRRDLKAAWRTLVLTDHTYERRIQSLLEAVGMA